jgi:hypothetical protein
MYPDSVNVLPFPEKNFVIMGKNMKGYWITKVSNREELEKILFEGKPNSDMTPLPISSWFEVSLDGNLIFDLRSVDGVRKMSLPDIKQKSFQKLPFFSTSSKLDAGYDGSEIVYTVQINQSKLVLIENLFK